MSLEVEGNDIIFSICLTIYVKLQSGFLAQEFIQ